VVISKGYLKLVCTTAHFVYFNVIFDVTSNAHKNRGRFREESAIFLLINIFIELTKRNNKLLFTIKPLHSCSLTYSMQHFLHTAVSLNFTYTLFEHVFFTCCGTFSHPTTSNMQEATRERDVLQ